MSIASYSELKTAIAAWQNKTSLTAYLADFITLAEAKFNRRLRTMDMEAVQSPVAIGADVGDEANIITPNTNFLAVKSIWTTGADQRSLEQKTLEYIQRMPVNAGVPKYYAFKATPLGGAKRIVFNATGATVTLVYYSKIPALSNAGPTNWLLLESPDLYLYAGIEQAAIYLKDDAAEKKYGDKANALIEELNSRDTANQLGGGPLVARAR